MNKRYLKQFLSLTEQNILGNQACANDDFENTPASSKIPTRRAFRMIRGFRIGLIAFILRITNHEYFS